MFNQLTKNFSKPEGLFGSLLVKSMNRGHAGMTNWALSLVDVASSDRVLDIGCGGGNAVFLLSERSDDVHGVDYSEVSVRQTMDVNRHAIEQGRVSVQQASVSALPFEDGSFDFITAFETIYFWPDWPSDFKEVYRVLKPGGRFMAVFEDAHDPERIRKMESSIPGMRVPPAREVEELFRAAGFAAASTHRDEHKV